MAARHGLMLLLLLPAAGCGKNPVYEHIDQELQILQKLTKIFNEVKDDKSLDYAVAAMEQPCVELAHLRKQRNALVDKMAPPELKSYEDSRELEKLHQATNRMETAFAEARRRIPNRAREMYAVLDKTGLGNVGRR
jgi:hypothetical protein